MGPARTYHCHGRAWRFGELRAWLGVSRAVLRTLVDRSDHTLERRVADHLAYRRARDVALANGIPIDAFRVRLHRGWPLERAAMVPARPRKRGRRDPERRLLPPVGSKGVRDG